ncbi:MAG: hypothetical protein ACI358_09350 [Candidatus Limimorpha sp.]
MSKYLIVAISLIISMSFLSCKSTDNTVNNYREKVFLPDKETKDDLTYEQLVKRHWDMQSESTMRNVKENKKKSDSYNEGKKRKGFMKRKPCNH